MRRKPFFDLTLADLGGLEGDFNLAGTGNNVSWAPWTDFLTFPELVTPAVNFEDLVTLDGDFTFKTGKCFKKIYLTSETGEIESKQIGQRDSMAFANVFKFDNPGNSAAILGFTSYMSNRQGVYLVEELDGRIRVFGDKRRGADLKGDENNKGKVDGGKATSFTIEFNWLKAPIYTGAISYTPAS